MTPSTILSASAPSGLRGCQEPRLSHVPAQSATAGDEAIALAGVAGLELDPWQQMVLRASLGERPDGRWSAFEVGLVVARQNGKDAILEARELWGLFIGGERTIVHSAHQFDTAMEHMERLAERIEATPQLRARLRRIVRTNGREGIVLKDGARIRFRARTRKGGARGYTGDCVIFNEAMDLPEPIVGAIMPIMSARSMRVPGPQIWYVGSAVNEETMPDGVVLARVREAGIAGENDRLAYFEWSADDDAGPADWDARAQANPGLGYRISPEYIEMEFRSPAMSATEFAVERMGQGRWPDTSEDAGRVISREAWAAIAESDTSKRIADRTHVFAVDANPDQTWSSIGVAGRRDDGMLQFALVAHERGTDWVVDRCQDLKALYPKARFVVDKRSTAAEKIDELRAARLRVIEASTEDYGRACIGFFTAVTEKRCRYPAPQPELDEALASARAKPLGDAWKWSRRESTGADISPLVTVTLALWAAEHGRGRARIINLNDL